MKRHISFVLICGSLSLMAQTTTGPQRFGGLQLERNDSREQLILRLTEARRGIFDELRELASTPKRMPEGVTLQDGGAVVRVNGQLHPQWIQVDHLFHLFAVIFTSSGEDRQSEGAALIARGMSLEDRAKLESLLPFDQSIDTDLDSRIRTRFLANDKGSEVVRLAAAGNKAALSDLVIKTYVTAWTEARESVFKEWFAEVLAELSPHGRHALLGFLAEQYGSMTAFYMLEVPEQRIEEERVRIQSHIEGLEVQK